MKPSKLIKEIFRRFNITLTKEEHQRFKLLAKEESRSMANFASILIRRYIKEAWEKRINPPLG